MSNEEDKQLTVEVFSGTLWEAEMIRTLLEASNISNFMKNSLLNVHLYEPIQSEGAKIIVLEKDEKEARKIVTDYIDNQNK
ncbi:DUF2007 domain-containing protein [Carboxylicivirga sp. A043]|uniref:DUF2007 domain-containing protein n=1 Tax=Carboxylicivirga litoralis TaxID=2816963 RepID=UPI0021CB30EB|nr:DUF2007 domain-containing protein [Carboxylicivirga sp. A043]MCU4155925.1 DUF2007 domain-containing protein [Carboxylicivirga sp. A043]